MSLEKKIEDLTLAVTKLTIAIGEMSKDSNVDLNPYEKALASKQTRDENDTTLIAVTPSDIEEAPSEERVPVSTDVQSEDLRGEIPSLCKEIMDKNRADKKKVQDAFATFKGALSLSQISDKDVPTLLSKLNAIKKAQK